MNFDSFEGACNTVQRIRFVGNIEPNPGITTYRVVRCIQMYNDSFITPHRTFNIVSQSVERRP